MRSLLPLALGAWLLLPAARGQGLVPAGTINGAVASRPAAVLTHGDPALLRSVAAIRDRFFQGAELVVERADPGVAGSIVVYGTPEHPWIAAHRERLPFSARAGAVEIEGRRFEGSRLRVIAALRNPADRERRVVLYWAEHRADLEGINGVFHGPTEWVVADGEAVLASGSFLSAATLSPEQMGRDLDELIARVAEVHPAAVDGLPAAVAEAAELCRKRLDEPLGRVEFARRCAGVLLALRDAHSALLLPGSGEGLALPLAWLEEGLVATEDAGELRRGDKVLALGGWRDTELFEALGVVLPAENPHWLRARGPALLADKGILRLLGVPVGPGPVKARIDRDGKRLDVDIGAGAAPAGRGAGKPWVRFEVDESRKLGVLTLDRCALDDTFVRTLRAFFTEVHAKGVRRVALDLRENSGGDSRVTHELMRYLKVDAFQDFSGDVRWSRPALEQRKARGEPRFEAAKPVVRRSVPYGDPPPFEGELLVLTGPATFSSASWLAVVLHDNGLARIVGEPTGTPPSHHGDVLTFTLPESCASYTLSFKRWVRPDRARDPADTLAPHVHVPRTRASVREGRDAVLEWLREQR